ncbi:MAG TPA: CAP domain-containing protein, partial [Longimicrobiaceae bacterium]|nr:CAP domain-containing protein [Longimicrobiaceae bacterium]
MKHLLAGRPRVRSAAPLGARSTPDSIRRPTRRRLRGWAAAALVALLGACEALPLGTDLDAASDGAAEQEFVSLVNEHRARLGCPSLSWDGRVAEVASGHSRDMALRGFFAHVTPDGVDPWQRLARGGVGYSTAGENIAHGITSGRQA